MDDLMFAYHVASGPDARIKHDVTFSRRSHGTSWMSSDVVLQAKSAVYDLLVCWGFILQQVVLQIHKKLNQWSLSISSFLSFTHCMTG